MTMTFQRFREERISNAQLIGCDRTHGELRFVRQF